MLSISRTSLEMEAIKNAFKCLVSQGTRYDSLCAAIMIAYAHGAKDAMFTSKFEVNRMSLDKLKSGEPISRGTEKYFEAVVTLLNDLRLDAKGRGDIERERDLTSAIMEVCLLRYGIAPDWELEEREKEKAKQAFFDSIKCKQE